MKVRFLWPAVAALALGGAVFAVSQVAAQRGERERDREARPPVGMTPPGMPGHGPGRFVVANASSSQVLILDTATGQVYRAKEADFKPLSELSRGMERPGRPPIDRDPPRRPRFDEKQDKEKSPPRRGPRADDDKQKENEPVRRPPQEDE